MADPKYIKELSDRRAKDPASYDKQKAMYDNARKMNAEDEDYSAIDTIKRVIKGNKQAEDMPKKKKGGCVKKYARGGGIEVRGKTKGRFV